MTMTSVNTGKKKDTVMKQMDILTSKKFVLNRVESVLRVQMNKIVLLLFLLLE